MTAPNPAEIAEALHRAGWEIAGHRTGVYVRLAWPDFSNRSLLIPLDKSAPEYEELLRAALAQLEQAMFTGMDAARALAAYRPDLYAMYATAR